MRNKSEDTFEIYQVKSGDKYRNLRFESIESLENLGLKVHYDNYDFIYKGDLNNMDLEDIFMKFNEARPDDYKGRSLSVSDIVVLNKEGEVTANFVDSFGFKNVPEFLAERERATHKEVSVLKKLQENKEKSRKKDKDKSSKKLAER